MPNQRASWPRFWIHRVIHSLLVAVASVFVACCKAPEARYRASHFDKRVWSQAADAFGRDTYQLMPALMMLGAVPAGFATDGQIQRDLDENRRLSDHSGDEMQKLMLEASSATAAIAWICGDQGRFFETWLETNAVNLAATHATKFLVARERPASNSKTSFPSGHTSFTVSMGALMARGFDDATEEWWGSLGYLFYVPGAITAVERVEQRQHFVSDVAAGALLGFTVGNIMWNAHYGSPGEAGLFDLRPQAQVLPIVDEDYVGFLVVHRF